MNFTFDWLIAAADRIAELVRSGLPLQYRQQASNWLIFSFLFFLGGVLLIICHFTARERPKVAWTFANPGYPVTVAARQAVAGGPWTYAISGIQIGGENVSGYDLHQIEGEIQLRDGKKLPLFLVLDGAWRTIDELEKIPPRAGLSLGAAFQSYGAHWEDFSSEISVDTFLQVFGGLTITVSIDGTKWAWTYSVDDLRRQIDGFKKNLEDAWFANPLNRPQPKRKVI